MHGFFIQNIGGFSGVFALVSQVGGTAGEQSGAESSAQGIYNPHGPLREILCQLLRRNPGSLDGPADAGGHSHIHHIPAPFQFRAEGLQKQVGVQQTGFQHRAAPEFVIIAMGVKGVDISQKNPGLTVQHIVTGKHLNLQFLQQSAGQIAAAVGIYGKRH